MTSPDDIIRGHGPEPGTGREREPTPFTRARLVAQLRSLGVRPGGVLLVHTSYRAVRPVEGGPEGLIAALAEAVDGDGTLVMPSWQCARERGRPGGDLAGGLRGMRD